MQAMISFQNELNIRIKKAYVNFKKTPKDRWSIEYVEGRLESLEQLWSEFLAGHKEIIRSSNQTELQTSPYIVEDLYDKTEENYITLKCELKQKLLQFISCLTDTSVVEKSSNMNISSQIRLPKINIPHFSGNYSEWCIFRDLFKSLIHHNKTLAEVEKLHYLKGYLTGEAEQLLRHIPIVNSNYERCWELLEQRYNNKKYICSQTLKRFLSQRNLVHETATGIKDLIDTTNDCLATLMNLGIDTNSWDILVIHILTLKLDSETRRQWEFNFTNSSKSSDALPSYEQFKEFLTSRYKAIEFLDSNPHASQKQSDFTKIKPKCMHVSNFTCELCGENHKLCFCKKFVQMDYNDRHEFVTKNRMCYNCLGNNHSVKACQCPVTCRICKRKHHSLLHPKIVSEASGSGGSQNTRTAALVACDSCGEGLDTSNGNNSDSSPIVSCFSSGQPPVYSQVLLATALVRATAANGEKRLVRALLDQGSQASFVSEAMAQYLGVKKVPVKGVISGLDGNKTLISKYMIQFDIQSRVRPEVRIKVQAYVLKNITTFLPNKKLVTLDWLDLSEMQLADPEYHTPNRIDILLGSEIYGEVIEGGVKKGPSNSPVAQATSLGWILSGAINKLPDPNSNMIAMHLCANDNIINDFLKKFWEIENDPKSSSKKILTEEEIKCEKFYNETTRRDEKGRYIVRLPFKTENPECVDGNSREIAVKRLKGLMNKLNRNKELKEKYTEVVEEYLHLDHMELIPEKERENDQCFYLPHHAVLRDDKDTTKVRIVFDASAKNIKGISLNDTLMIGPTLQPELRHLIMRWRISPICLAADIVKMYRQIKVHEQVADFQRIVWKENETNEMQDYRIKRVTFGTAAAPYLAVKTLQQTALDEGAQFPIAAKRVTNDFYMDDLLTGCDSVEEGILVYEQMNQLLKKAGFELQKWMSNNEELLNRIKQTNTEEGLKLKLDTVVKLLGLTWNRATDVFKYSVNLPQGTGLVTKRKMISEIAKLYDPLGWLAPTVIIAKILIQKLWISGVEWDDEVSSNLIREWHIYRSGLSKLVEISIPRWFGGKFNESRTELHGFSDASKSAYAAAVYIRLVDDDGAICVTLVTAKTKVAPIKQISIPKLELCGAVLVTRLLVEVAEVLEISKNNIRAWTDSTVVLAWLNSHPSKWQTFVANRVSEILSTLDSQHWYHVPSDQNPADCASRGVDPSDQINQVMWFNGPEFLRNKVINYYKPKDIETHIEVAKVHLTVTDSQICERYSSLTRLVRIIAYCRRFLRLRKGSQKSYTTYLSSQELREALETCVKICQKENFREEIARIERDKEYSAIKGPLKSLNPFLDHTGILRVGGRLQKSQLQNNSKHPILLPKKSHLTDLIVDDAHGKSLHGGPQLMLTLLGTKYYILGGKLLVKARVRRCIKCIRYLAPSSTQLMGQLPSSRVSPGRTFQNSGVDFAGPINVRTTKGRGHHATKGYICLFICMATTAIHLEVVSDLTTQSFLAAFRRFVARRGLCTDIWSDNGTNFVGANRELQKLFVAQNSNLAKEVAEYLATNGTTWHFIPPRSPNFGGLWEAGIKSTKFHLKRVVGELTLTYEELATVLTQIEACLNSRPLSRIDSDRDSIEVLTPGHFLVGGPLLAVPDENYDQSNVSCLRRWLLVQKLTQTFWKRWSQEYLTKFLHRYKWAYQNPEPEIGDVVLIKEDDLPPGRWLLGRVAIKHPGTDNITRVVTLQTHNSQVKRPTTKICVLPICK